jgi:O-antigen biosynthesis protein
LSFLYNHQTFGCFLDLSIIIVNYNVKHFLEQCLKSVERACTSIKAEVLVVDNASVDDSLAYLQPKFPHCHFVRNEKNVGFGMANNQALPQCKGEFVLFLNPDTLVKEDCFEKCIQFMRQHADAGSLGIRMLDGSGQFLKESKRAFPSPLTSLYKLSGLSTLFPTNANFAKYHLGNLSEHASHKVDVLAGAFMMVRKTVLDKTGGFDPAFFMYGEDVDLSYRIQQAGFANYYFADSSIIHFKGESTKKGSLNYVRMFYQAMSIFVRKHYGGGKAALFNACIQAAIGARAAFSAFTRFVRWIGLPLLDMVFLFFSIWLLKELWPVYVKKGVVFDDTTLKYFIPAYVFTFLLTCTIAGVYDKYFNPRKVLFAGFFAILVTLAIYSLLPERIRFSRGVILLGGLLGLLSMLVFRWLLFKWRVLQLADEQYEKRQTIIVGTQQEFDDVIRLMQQANRKERVLGRIGVVDGDNKALGSLSNLPHLLQHLPCKELIFCAGKLSYTKIIDSLHLLPKDVRIKFHAHQSQSIIGSDSKDSSGEALGNEEFFAIRQPDAIWNKRLLDVFSSLAMLVSCPLLCWFSNKPIGYINNIFAVLIGQKTWVGYNVLNGLPKLKAAIITCSGAAFGSDLEVAKEGLHNIDYWYAKDYDWVTDAKLMLRYFKQLGN